MYLSPFDHFVKEVLGAPAYARYVDDFLLLSDDKAWLATARERCRAYLETLRLRLHPRKSVIVRVEDGVRFVGYRVFPGHRRLVRDNVTRMTRRLRWMQAAFARGELSAADVRPFFMSRYPVTNSQYDVFVRDGGYDDARWWSDDGRRWLAESGVREPVYWRRGKWNNPSQPVVGVSFWEAQAFSAWAGGRLPTEAEWECAARGPKGFAYPWGDEWEDGICNTYEARLVGTSAVGLFPRSRSRPFGLEDMAGNVLEWCSDIGKRERLGEVGVVLRGGSWDDVAGNARSAIRVDYRPDDRNGIVGFRVGAAGGVRTP